MKKTGVLVAALALLVAVVPVFAAKPADLPGKGNNACATIQDGTIFGSDGSLLSMGYNEWGYNYQAKMFNGMWCDYHPLYRPGGAYHDWCVENYGNVELMMKWNDAWLSNKDCSSDGLLDRHFGYESYRGSGAWLTNHAKGTYTSSTSYQWDVSDYWLLDFAGGTDNREFRNLVQDEEGNVTGEFWWLNGGTWEYGGTLVGTLSGDTLQLHYDRDPIPYTGDFEGTIGEDVITNGTFSDSHGNYLLWSATGTSEKVYETCPVSDFVKIVAVPLGAYHDPEVETFYGEGMWYESEGGSEIGPAIWGDFAVIQEISDDACGEYGTDYMSPLKKGLGNWASDF